LKIYVFCRLRQQHQEKYRETKAAWRLKYLLINRRSKTKIIDLEVTLHEMLLLIVTFDNRFQKEKTSSIKVEAIMIFLDSIFHMSSNY